MNHLILTEIQADAKVTVSLTPAGALELAEQLVKMAREHLEEPRMFANFSTASVYKDKRQDFAGLLCFNIRTPQESKPQPFERAVLAAKLPWALAEDLLKLNGLGDYASPSNPCVGDGYFAASIENKYSQEHRDAAMKIIRKVQKSAKGNFMQELRQHFKG